jgi:beta-glucanase (GH16 family)
MPMRRLHATLPLAIASLLTLLPAALACQEQPRPTAPTNAPPGYRLVWSDEFDGGGAPNPTRWSYDVGGGGWGNNELQFYTADRRENARLDGGYLVIEARREPWEGRDYTSARLVTKGKGDWTYARIDVRAQLPSGRGSWPAIWMLGSTTPLRWPDDGEIDIMEHVGFDAGVVHGTVHTGAYNHTRNNHRSATTTVADACNEFHRYQATWSASRITVGVDDRNYFQYSNDNSGNAEWPFDSPQYLILNIAIGGDWGGQQGVNDAIFPVQMEVDYVRVYQQ